MSVSNPLNNKAKDKQAKPLLANSSANRRANRMVHTLQYCKEHPWRAAFRSLMPLNLGLRSFLNLQAVSKIDKHIFAIYQHLVLMGYEQLAINLATNVVSSEKQGHQKLEETLIALYEAFEYMAVRVENLSENKQAAANANLKTLKRLLHHFAEHNNLERRLVTIARVLKDKKSLLQQNDHQHYAYDDFKRIPRGEAYKNEKANVKVRKRWFVKLPAYFVTGVVSVAETLMCVAFAMTAGASTPLILAIGIGAFFVNLLLFKPYSLDTAKLFFIKGIFKNPQTGEKDSFGKKIIKSAATLFASASAVGMGCILFSSAKTALPAILALAGLTFNPVGLAVVIGALSGIALGAVFWYSLIGFINADGHRMIKNAFISRFINVWKKTTDEVSTVKHYLQATAKFAASFVTVSAAAALSVIMAVSSGGMLFNGFVNVMHKSFHLSMAVSRNLGIGGFLTLGGSVNAFFYANGIFPLMERVRHGAEVAIKAIINPSRAFNQAKQNVGNFIHSNPLNKVAKVVSGLSLAVVTAMVGLNAKGNAEGPYKDSLSKIAVSKVTGNTPKQAGQLAYGTAFFASVGANQPPAEEALTVAQSSVNESTAAEITGNVGLFAAKREPSEANSMIPSDLLVEKTATGLTQGPY